MTHRVNLIALAGKMAMTGLEMDRTAARIGKLSASAQMIGTRISPRRSSACDPVH
jgi:hypothetical protein